MGRQKATWQQARVAYEYKKLANLLRAGHQRASGRQAGVVLDQARLNGVTLTPEASLAVGMALAYGDRPLDATNLLQPNLAVAAEPMRLVARVLLVREAETAGRFAIAIDEGKALVADPALEGDSRFLVLLHVAEAVRHLGHLDAGADWLSRAGDAASAGPPELADKNLALVEMLRGVHARSAGDGAAAEGRLRGALAMPALGHSAVCAHALMADVLVSRGDLAGAAHELDRAKHADHGGHKRSDRCEYDALVTASRGRLRLAEGAPRDALTLLDRAEADLVELQRAPRVAEVHQARSAALLALGRHDEAHELLVQARGEFAHLGCVLEVAEIDRVLGGGPAEPAAPRPTTTPGPVIASEPTAAAPPGATDPRAWGLGSWDPGSGSA